MADLAVRLVDRGDCEEAEPLVRDALGILRGKLPENRQRVVEVQSTLGVSLTGQGRFEEAEPLLLGSFSMLRDETGLEHPSTQATAVRLVTRYEEWGRRDDARR